MKIYWSETVNPRKVCSVAKYLGVDAEYVHVDLKSGAHKQADFLGINPNGRVPALTDGDVRLWESAAICAYLAGNASSPLWPAADVRAQAEILKATSWHIAHGMPMFGPFYFEHYIKPLLGLGAPDEAKLDALRPQARASAKVLDALLAEHSFLACDRLTIADFISGAIFPDWKAHGMPLDDCANLRRWIDSLLTIDAFREPWPRSRRQRDLLPQPEREAPSSSPLCFLCASCYAATDASPGLPLLRVFSCRWLLLRSPCGATSRGPGRCRGRPGGRRRWFRHERWRPRRWGREQRGGSVGQRRRGRNERRGRGRSSTGRRGGRRCRACLRRRREGRERGVRR